MKADLADFEQALKDGFITEEQMQAAFEEVDRVQQNYERLSYIMYLLNLPNREAKRKRPTNTDIALAAEFEKLACGYADGSDYALGLCNAVTVNGNVSLNHGHTLSEISTDSCDCGNVANEATEVDGMHSLAHYLAECVIDDSLFATVRIG